MTPEGWDRRRIGELVTNIGDGGTPRRDNPSYFGGDVPWVVIQDIKPLITVTKNTLTKKGLDACSAKLWPKNAVILSTGATIGEVGIAGVPLATKQGITGMVCEEYVIPKFLYYLLQQKKQYLQTLAQGSTIREVRPPTLKKIDITLPPKFEQKKIAAILSSVDDTIQATQAVIDQTRTVKQGLMQQLLTRGIGHTRFKQTDIGEIPEEWDVVRLGEIFSNRKEPGISGIPVMSVTMNDGLVERHTLDRRVVSELLPEKHLRAHKGDLVYNMMRMWQGASGVAWNDCIVSPAYVLCNPSDLILPRFIAQFFKAPATIRKLHQHSQGITEDRLRLYFHNFAEIVIGLPPKIEQEQISDILESIENEITSLKNELNSLQRIKKAMMEDLLTGRVRVKLDGEITT